MTISIRSRLTLWYSAVVVAVLVSGAIVGSLAQSRLALQGLDDDLTRTMATLVGVMHNEFGEGLTLDAAAEEASGEVVAPGHALVLCRSDGTVLAAWGVPVDVPSIVGRPVQTAAMTVALDSAHGVRVLTQEVAENGHRYRAFVAAPLEALATQHAAMVRALSIGVVIALVIAAAGGWLIGRQTLRPLSAMAAQASEIDGRDPSGRLATPHADDELGTLAAAFNGLLDRLATALHQQRQFMADASHELRTPVSVVRTAAQVTLSKSDRSADEYHESLTIVEEQANRLARLVDAMFLLSRAEAYGVPLRLEFVNLDDIVAETVRAARVLAERRAVAYRVGGRAGGRVPRRRPAAPPDARQPVGQRHPSRRLRRRRDRPAVPHPGPDPAAGAQRRARHRAGRPGAHLRAIRSRRPVRRRRARPADCPLDSRGARRHLDVGGECAGAHGLRRQSPRRACHRPLGDWPGRGSEFSAAASCGTIDRLATPLRRCWGLLVLVFSVRPSRCRCATALLLSLLVLVPSVLHAASPDGTRLPPAPIIDDGYGGTWTLGADGAVRRNGYHMAGGYATQLLVYANAIYALGYTDGWWRFAGTSWVNVGRDPLASADGTRAPRATYLMDNTGGVWTMGANQVVIRNGVHMAGGYASQLLWHGGAIYALGTDTSWWRWTGSGWQWVGADPQSPTFRPAARAAAFVDTVGVNTRFNYLETAYYFRWDTIRDLLLQSGIRHIRDGVPYMQPWYNDRLNALHTLGGIRTLSVLGPQADADHALAALLNDVHAVEGVEALNEWDLSGRADWVNDVRNYQWRVRDAMRRQPRAAGLPLLAPSLTTWESAEAVGDIGAAVDRGNLHDYYNGRHPETLGWGDRAYGSLPWHRAMSGLVAPGATIWSSETGYPSDRGMPDWLVARYLPRLLLDHFAAGIARTYLFQLVDTYTWRGPIDAFSSYGLIRSDGTPKPQYHAVRNLMTLLTDGGAQFTPGRLDYWLTPSISDLRQVLLQKQDGTFYLALWLAREGMDPTTHQLRPMTTESVLLMFNATPRQLTLYTLGDDGMMGVRTLPGDRGVRFDVTEQVQLLRVAW